MSPSILEPPFPLLHPKRKMSAGEKGAGMAVITVFLAGADSNLVVAILFTMVALVCLVVVIVNQVRYNLALRQVRPGIRVDEEHPRALTTRSPSRPAQSRPPLAAPTPTVAPVRVKPIPAPVRVEPLRLEPIQRGRRARIDGASIVDDPYRPGTPESDAWLRGWAGFRDPLA
jgi:hypothetical protein